MSLSAVSSGWQHINERENGQLGFDYQGVAVTGWTYNGAGNLYGVATDAYYLFTSGSVVYKVDVLTGSVTTATPGSTLGAYCALGLRDGIERIYVLDTANRKIICLKVSDLSQLWITSALPNAVNAVGLLTVHNTASGLMVTVTDDGGSNTCRCFRDDGSSYTNVWNSTVINSYRKVSSPGGDFIQGGRYAAKASDGTQKWDSGASGITSGVAMSIDPADVYGYARSGSAPYNIVKIQLSDGTTSWTLTTPTTPTNIAEEPVIVPGTGDFIIWAGTAVKAYDASKNALWTYTHFESVGALWIDESKRIFISGATKIQCLAYADRSLIWETTASGYKLTPATAQVLISHISNYVYAINIAPSTFDRVVAFNTLVERTIDRALAFNALVDRTIDRSLAFNSLVERAIDRAVPFNSLLGLTIDRLFPMRLGGPTDLYDRELPLNTLVSLAFDRVLPWGSSAALQIDRTLPILYDISDMLRVNRELPFNTSLQLDILRTLPVSWQESVRLLVDRGVPFNTLLSLIIDRTLPFNWQTLEEWIKQAAESDNWTKQAAAVDDWVKQVDATGDWSKV